MRRGALAAALVLLMAGASRLLSPGRAEGQYPVSNLLEPTPKPGTVRRPATTPDGGAGAFTEKGQEPPEAPADEDGRKKLPSQIASLDIHQGTARDRLVLYDDGTVSLAETRHGDTHERRRTISAAERILVSRVLAEAATVPRKEPGASSAPSSATLW